MNKNIITLGIVAIFSSSATAGYLMRAPLKKDYNFYPNTEYVYGEWEDIGTPENCKVWLPEPQTIEFGTVFEQSRDCDQSRSRTVQVIHKNPDTGDEIIGDSYTEFDTYTVQEHQDSTGILVNFNITLSSELEYQNNESITAIAEAHSAEDIMWDSSSSIDISGNGNKVTLTANSNIDGWVRYQLIDSDGNISAWSQNKTVPVINDYVDTRYLQGTTYQGNGRGLGISSIHSNYSFETWVKPHKAIKLNSVAGNTGIDGTHGENYAFYPIHGGHDSHSGYADSHGMGLSVGTNGYKIHIHSASYMPAVFVRYETVSPTNWTHFAVSVKNNKATIYKNGKAVGSAYVPFHGSAISPVSVGDSSSYGSFYGELAESRVWNKGLTADEISSLYQRHLKSHTTSSGAKLIKVLE